MLYRFYEKKMKKLAKVGMNIAKHKILILSSFAFIVLFVSTFLSTKGIVISKLTCNTKVEYGDTLDYSAKALFSKVNYEFNVDGSWTDEEPIMPGKYQIRAVTNRSFNKGYSDPIDFEITTKQIQLFVNENEIQYGDEGTVGSTKLAYNDKLLDADILFEDISKKETNAEIDLSSVKIVNENGIDLTKAYTLSSQTKQINFINRRITIEIDDISKVYDGSILIPNDNNVSVTEGTLLSTDTLSYDLVGGQTNYGTSKSNLENVKIFNGNVDVSVHYDITIVGGNINIEKLPISISTPSVELVYDGLSHSFDNVKVVDNTKLVENHQIVTSNVKEFIFAGSYENKMDVSIYDDNNQDVTYNYEISLFNGNVNLAPRLLIITTPDISKVYDSKALTNQFYTVEDYNSFDEDEEVKNAIIELLKNFEPDTEFDYQKMYGLDKNSDNYITVKTPFSKIDAGSYENTIELSIFNRTINSDVTDNYYIVFKNGTAVIEKKPIKIKPLDQSLIYGDTLNTNYEYLLGPASDSDMKNSYEFIQNYTVLPKLELTNIDTSEVLSTFNADNLVVGLYKAKITALSFLNDTVDVTDECMNNYDIDISTESFVFINKKNVSITINEIQKEYTGFVFDSSELFEELAYQDTGIIDGYSISNIEFDVNNKINVGSYELELIPNSLKITKANDSKDYSDNYNISLNRAFLTITKKPIIVDIENQVATYSGSQIDTNSLYTSTSVSALLPQGQIIEATDYIFSLDDVVVDDVINVNDYKVLTNQSSIVIKDSEDNILNDNYTIRINPGYLSVLQKEITVKTGSTSKEYDGTDISYTEIAEDGVTGLFEGFDALYDDTNPDFVTKVKDVSSVMNYFPVKIMNGTSDVTRNFKINIDPGTITVTPKEINVTFNPRTDLVYKGMLYDYNEVLGLVPYELDAELIAGEEIDSFDFITTGELINAGSYVLSATGVALKDGKLSSNYQFNFDNVIVNIAKKPITLTTKSNTYTYDGEAKSYAEYDNVVDLISGHSINIVSESIKSIINAGSIVNDFGIQIFSGETEVTDNYLINYEYGVLNINKANILVSTGNAEKIYDKKPLSNPLETVLKDAEMGVEAFEEKFIVLNNDELTPSITNAGKIFNSCSAIVMMNEEDVTANFNISYEYGTLTVKPKTVIVRTEDIDITYNGSVQEINPTMIFDGYLEDNEPTYDVSFSETEFLHAGQYKYNIILTKINGENISDINNYSFTASMGIVNVRPRLLVIKPRDIESEYTGANVLVNPEYQIINIADYQSSELASIRQDMDKINIEYDGSQIFAGTSKIIIKNISTSDEYVLKDNLIDYSNFGSLTVTPEIIEIDTEDVEYIYDGTQKTELVYVYEGVKYGYGQAKSKADLEEIFNQKYIGYNVKCEIQSTASITNVFDTEDGTVPATFTFKFIDKTTLENVTSDLAIVKYNNTGKIIVSPKSDFPIVVKNKKVVYSGEINYWTIEDLSVPGLAPTDTFVYLDQSESNITNQGMKDVGSINSNLQVFTNNGELDSSKIKFVSSLSGIDVSRNYIISLENVINGTLTVEKLQVKITSASAIENDINKTLKNDHCDIIATNVEGGKLPENIKIECKASASLTLSKTQKEDLLLGKPVPTNPTMNYISFIEINGNIVEVEVACEKLEFEYMDIIFEYGKLEFVVANS